MEPSSSNRSSAGRLPAAVDIVRFLSLLFVALALAPGLAHLFELPNKIGLPASDYLVVQKIYRGWQLLGIVVVGAVASTLTLTILHWRRRQAFVPALIAFVCVAATQAVFWTFTFPVNRQTENWTLLPQGWEALRSQWEYSHAASALLTLTATVAVILAVLRR